MNEKRYQELQEEWRDVPGYEGIYQVSNTGRVKALTRVSSVGRHLKERILKPSNINGYHGYNLCRGGERQHFYAHQLVYMTFIGEIAPPMEIDHINKVRDDNRPENLRLFTRKQNMQFRRQRGADNYAAKLSWEQADDIRNRIQNPQVTQAELAREYEVTPTCINNIVSGKTYVR